jgi:hypothetical protein
LWIPCIVEEAFPSDRRLRKSGCTGEVDWELTLFCEDASAWVLSAVHIGSALEVPDDICEFGRQPLTLWRAQ